MGNNILQFLVTVVVFILVLAAVYYVTKWIARSGAVQMQSKNIKVVETFKIAPNKYIQIIRLGTKYYSIGVTKENITFLAELSEEQLDLQREEVMQNMSFKDVMGKVVSAIKKKDNNE